MSKRTGSIVSELDEKLDSIFGKDETENFSFKERGPSPLAELKGLMLTIDWEISDDTITAFNNELESLKRLYAGDSIVPPLLKMLSSLTAYLKSKKAAAHNDTLGTINAVYRALETVVEDDNLTAQEKHILVDKEIGDFKKFKAGLAASPKPAARPAARVAETPVVTITAEPFEPEAGEISFDPGKEEYDFPVTSEEEASKAEVTEGPVWEVKEEGDGALDFLSPMADESSAAVPRKPVAVQASTTDLTSVVKELRQAFQDELAVVMQKFESHRKELEMVRSELASLRTGIADFSPLRSDIAALSSLRADIAGLTSFQKDIEEIKAALAGAQSVPGFVETTARELEVIAGDFTMDEPEAEPGPRKEAPAELKEHFPDEMLPVSEDTEQRILDLDDMDALEELAEYTGEEKPGADDDIEKVLSMGEGSSPDVTDTIPDFSMEDASPLETEPLADAYFIFELGGRKYAVEERNVIKACKGNGRLLKKARKKGTLSMLDVKPPFAGIKRGIEGAWKYLSAKELKTSPFRFVQNDSIEGSANTRGGGILFLGVDEMRAVLITDNLPRKESSGTETELRSFPDSSYVCGELVKGGADGECYRILDARRLM